MKAKIFSLVLGADEIIMLEHLVAASGTNRNATVRMIIRNAYADLQFKNRDKQDILHE